MIFFPILSAGMAASVCAAVAVCWPLALLNAPPKQKPNKTVKDYASDRVFEGVREPSPGRVAQLRASYQRRTRLSVMKGGRE